MDYVRNIGEHYLIGQDINHSGAARSFNQANARPRGTPPNSTAAGCPWIWPGYVHGHGLRASRGSDRLFFGRIGFEHADDGRGPLFLLRVSRHTQRDQHPERFRNGALGRLDMLLTCRPLGLQGLQVKLVETVLKPWPGVKTANFQVSYSLSQIRQPGAGPRLLSTSPPTTTTPPIHRPQRPRPQTPDFFWWHFRSAVLHQA